MVHKSTRIQSVGQYYHDFRITKIHEISELQCILYELTHEPSGAHIIHIANDDPENLFCLSFPTFPSDSKGVAHILEHAVLCGSKKFPVKDPFFAMNRRSLNTFMNALTGSDFTCYPAATQVHKDFYNLLDVYLDAVFNPNLHELSFLQEGCRLEFSDSSNPDSPLEYKGIVYNEMKGSLSSPNARLAEALNASLYPNVTYGYNSGGDPKDIPNLTYEEFKEFHQLFYQPSRCIFFFYGNMPLEKHLDFIAAQTLHNAPRLPKLPPVPFQPRFKEPVRKTLTYPIPADEETKDKTIIAFAWLTCPIYEQEEALALSILQNILLDTDASPLKMALLKSGLCKQVSYFIDLEINEIPVGLTLNGCNGEHADTLETLIRNTLKTISLGEISPELIENAIHQSEFSRSEITGDGSPFGLSLFMRSVLLKQHGINPELGLTIHSLFDRLRQHTLNDPLYFSRLIKKYYLDNTHFVRIIMKPDPHLQAEEEEEEKQKLTEIRANLTSDQVQRTLDRAKELADFQKRQEEADDDILPKVTIREVPLLARDYPLTKEKIGPLETYHHNVFTNEIVYADLAFDLPNLPEEDLPLLRLFEIILTQVGSGSRNYVENLEYIQGNTGGIGAGLSLNLQAQDHRTFRPVFHLRGKALYRKASKLFPLLYDTLVSPDLTCFERVREIIFKHFTGMENRLSQSALKYAINLSSSALNVPAKVANDLYGLPYYLRIRDMVLDFDRQGPRFMDKLQEIRENVLRPERPHLILGCDNRMYDELKGHGFYGLKELQTATAHPWSGNFPLAPIPPQGRIIASPVAFIGKVFPTVSYVNPHAPALSVAAHLFDNLTLHPLIREQGGAYGGGAANNPMSGNFYFYSYRDPNITKTLFAFREAIRTVSRGDFDESDLEEAKLETIQAFDSPLSPGSQGEVAYCWMREGKTFDLRHAFRTRILALTREELIQAVREVIEPQYDKGSVVVFAGKNLLEEENIRLTAEGFTPLIIETI